MLKMYAAGGGVAAGVAAALAHNKDKATDFDLAGLGLLFLVALGAFLYAWWDYKKR